MLLLIIRIIYSALETNDIRTAIVSLLKLYSKNQSLKSVLDSENVSNEEIDQPYSTFNPNIIKKLISLMKPSELTELKTQLDKLVFKPIKKVNNLFKEDKKDINDLVKEIYNALLIIGFNDYKDFTLKYPNKQADFRFKGSKSFIRVMWVYIVIQMIEYL